MKRGELTWHNSQGGRGRFRLRGKAVPVDEKTADEKKTDGEKTDEKKTARLRFFLSVTAGAVAVMALALVCHLIGFVSRPTQAGYPFTNYLAVSLNVGSIAVYIGLGGLLGYMFRQAVPVALGMMLPWPIACIVEMIQDPTSHNMFPFEAILFWTPAFFLALLGARFGRKMAERNSAAELSLTNRN